LTITAETAKRITFMLLEDEHGTINLIVGADVYERSRTVELEVAELRAVAPAGHSFGSPVLCPLSYGGKPED
jgi:hypothetical protein